MKAWLEILVMGLIVMLGEGFLHYLPWRLILRKREQLEAPWNYVLGVVAMMGPYGVLLQVWTVAPPEGSPFGWALLALGTAIGSAGLMVIGAYQFDKYIQYRAQSEDLQVELAEMRAMGWPVKFEEKVGEVDAVG